MNEKKEHNSFLSFIGLNLVMFNLYNIENYTKKEWSGLLKLTLLIIPLSSIQSEGIWDSLQLRIKDSLVRRRL